MMNSACDTSPQFFFYGCAALRLPSGSEHDDWNMSYFAETKSAPHGRAAARRGFFKVCASIEVVDRSGSAKR
jgi:hypothetical protein